MDLSGKRVLVVGAGGHARVILDILEQRNAEIRGCLDDDPLKEGRPFAGTMVLGPTSRMQEMRKAEPGLSIIIAIGDNSVRRELFVNAREMGYEFVRAVHPSVVQAPSVKIGVGAMVCAGVVLNPGVEIGNNAIVNTASSVDHDSKVGAHAHICPGVHTGGHVAIAELAFVGLGSSVLPRIRIGTGCIVGAGSVVIRDVPDGATAYGVPGRIRCGVVT
ncbi:MAG: acetyltransferase [Candidatus Omnitrophica bacterium]|nr:acetyltransferase [Candidatus Omnitrophota bacterium]